MEGGELEPTGAIADEERKASEEDSPDLALRRLRRTRHLPKTTVHLEEQKMMREEQQRMAQKQEVVQILDFGPRTTKQKLAMSAHSR